MDHVPDRVDAGWRMVPDEPSETRDDHTVVMRQQIGDTITDVHIPVGFQWHEVT